MKMTKKQIIDEVAKYMVELYFDKNMHTREVVEHGVRYMAELMEVVENDADMGS